MRVLFFFFCLVLMVALPAMGQYQVSGTVTDSSGKPLPYASVSIRNASLGTTANNIGHFQLSLPKGKHLLVCQQVGYVAAEKQVTILDAPITVNFILSQQQYRLKEVVVQTKKEDLAYGIIRKAIAKRAEHLSELHKFQCEVYIKGQMQLRDFPKKLMGENVTFDDGDTSKRKMLFLSESLANYYVDGDKKKIEVVATKVSGRAGGFGFSSPQIISFYNNIVSIGQNLNPRGFISPIANNALHYYKYRLMGSFYENGKEINQIQVTPLRKYEPLFSGTIYILEDEWRLHSVQLTVVKDQQIQLLDTLTIQQLYVPLQHTWVIKQQVIYPSGKFFGFDFFGNFLQVYRQFNLTPTFDKSLFNHTLITFQDSSNKKKNTYWDTMRPIPLLPEEIKDYLKKDSIEQVQKQPRYIDSMDRVNNKLSLSKLFVSGQQWQATLRKRSFSIQPFLSMATSINTVEGFAPFVRGTYTKEFANNGKWSISPYIRYGTSNHHWNGQLDIGYQTGKKNVQKWGASVGQQVIQWNNENPVGNFGNAFSTLFFGFNYMKLYEAKFAKITWEKELAPGLRLALDAHYQQRQPLENTFSNTWYQVKDRAFTPNYPVEKWSENLQPHNAFITSLEIYYSFKARYIEFPDQKINIGTKHPTLRLVLTKGVKGWLASDVDFAKWQAEIKGKIPLKLAGRLEYQATLGGFINRNTVFAPDYKHYWGNQTYLVSRYMDGFLLLPYYSLSNTADCYAATHFAYHLNGFLTNKIPVLKQLNWFFVVGANTLAIHPDERYYEGYFSIENIFKIMRVDVVQSLHQGQLESSGFRCSFKFPQRGRGR